MSSLLTLNIFHTLIYSFYCWLWAGNCWLGKVKCHFLVILVARNFGLLEIILYRKFEGDVFEKSLVKSYFRKSYNLSAFKRPLFVFRQGISRLVHAQNFLKNMLVSVCRVGKVNFFENFAYVVTELLQEKKLCWC